MIVEAENGDKPALEAYLATRYSTTMFMRGNLRAHGLGNKTAPYAMRYFIRVDEGEITGVGALANIGAIMLQAGKNRAEIVDYIAGILPRGFKPHAITGAPEQVAALISGLKLDDLQTHMNEIEPLFVLNKAELSLPDMAGFTLRPSNINDLPQLAAWNFAYNKEVLGEPDTESTRKKTYEEAVRTVEQGNQRVLIKDGNVLAQTNFNAVLPDAVQIGGVYTAPENRGLGFARRAVAAHLKEAFSGAVKHAILFSASDSASKAYQAIGFRRIGEYQIVLFT